MKGEKLFCSLRASDCSGKPTGSAEGASEDLERIPCARERTYNQFLSEPAAKRLIARFFAKQKIRHKKIHAGALLPLQTNKNCI